MSKSMHSLRNLTLKLGVSGTAVPIAETRLYKGSYGFVKLQVYVPKTQNTQAPICTAFCTTTDELGREKISSRNHNLMYVGEFDLEGQTYLLFESLLPKEFTQKTTSADGLKLTFNYFDTEITTDESGEIILDSNGVPKRHATDLLVSSTYITTVYQGGWNDEGVELNINTAEVGQIVANMQDIAEIQNQIGEIKFIADGTHADSSEALKTAKEAKTIAESARDTATGYADSIAEANAKSTSAVKTANNAVKDISEYKAEINDLVSQSNRIANEANDNAKIAKEQSNNAVNDANEAKLNADNAVATANDAKEKIDEAVELISNSKASIEEAIDIANQAKQDYDTASTGINETKELAESAITKADEALSRSNTALEKSISTERVADDAISNSRSAVEKSNNAESSATTAYNWARNALDKASAANTLSESVVETANQAKDTANSAETTANNANFTANEAKRMVTETADATTKDVASYKDKIDATITKLEEQIVQGSGGGSSIYVNGAEKARVDFSKDPQEQLDGKARWATDFNTYLVDELLDGENIKSGTLKTCLLGDIESNKGLGIVQAKYDAEETNPDNMLEADVLEISGGDIQYRNLRKNQTPLHLLLSTIPYGCFNGVSTENGWTISNGPNIWGASGLLLVYIKTTSGLEGCCISSGSRTTATYTSFTVYQTVGDVTKHYICYPFVEKLYGNVKVRVYDCQTNEFSIEEITKYGSVRIAPDRY